MKAQLRDDVWYDTEGTYYVLLDVTQQIDEQQPRVVDGVVLMPKDELHVSIVPTSRLTDDESVRGALIADIRDYLAENPSAVQFENLGPERYFCQKADEATLIAPAVVSGTDGLVQVVRRHFPDFEATFLHVTLLKNAESEYGIGINNPTELKQYCTKLS